MPSPPTMATRSALSRSGTSGPKASVQLASPAATSARSSEGSAGSVRPDGREVGAAVERPPQLLEENGLLEERQPGAAVLLRDGHARPAELGELRPGGLRGGGEELTRLLAEGVLLGGEGEVHGSWS